MRRMDDVVQGRICRALRRRLSLTQRQLGRRAGLSQQAVSLVERGHGSRLSGVAMRGLFGALDARWEPIVCWRGGDLDRFLDARHAQLVGMAVNLLRSLGWEVEVEVTYSSFGERGSIDILAWWPFARIALVVEIKSELASVEATLRKLDEKVRLTIDSIADSVWRTAAGRRSIARPSGHHDRTASSQSRRRRTRRGSPGARHAPSSVAPTPEWADPRNLVRCRYQPGW
jgi:transcriptional regulator with XRE-family HTH domain